MHSIPVNPTRSHTDRVREEGCRGFNQGFNNFRMGSACLSSQYPDNDDLLLTAQQGRRCVPLMGLEGWPLRVLVFPFHLVSLLIHLWRPSLPQILQLGHVGRALVVA